MWTHALTAAEPKRRLFPIATKAGNEAGGLDEDGVYMKGFQPLYLAWNHLANHIALFRVNSVTSHYLPTHIYTEVRNVAVCIRSLA